MKLSLKKMKSQHREALIKIYQIVGSSRFVFAHIRETTDIQQQLMRSMGYEGTLVDCGPVCGSIPTKSWRIAPHLIPELIELCGEVNGEKESEKAIYQFSLKRKSLMKGWQERQKVTV